MNEKPIYRLEVKSRRTGKKIKHFLNNEGYGFYCGNNEFTKMTDERIRDIARGVVYGLMNDMRVYVEAYKLNDRGTYDIIHTQF